MTLLEEYIFSCRYYAADGIQTHVSRISPSFGDLLGLTDLQSIGHCV